MYVEHSRPGLNRKGLMRVAFLKLSGSHCSHSPSRKGLWEDASWNHTAIIATAIVQPLDLQCHPVPLSQHLEMGNSCHLRRMGVMLKNQGGTGPKILM